jgi:hypothetical protein
VLECIELAALGETGQLNVAALVVDNPLLLGQLAREGVNVRPIGWMIGEWFLGSFGIPLLMFCLQTGSTRPVACSRACFLPLLPRLLGPLMRPPA